MEASPGVHFVTASQLPKLYPDRLRSDGATMDDAMELAKQLAASDSPGVDFKVFGQKAFSAADQFDLLCDAVCDHIHLSGKHAGTISIPADLLGPDAEPPAKSLSGEIPWTAFRDATLDAQDFVHQHHRIPSRVFIGADAVAPADFLVAMADVLLQREKSRKFPDSVVLPQGVKMLPAAHVTHDGPNVYGGWIIHRQGYQAPHILEIARLQAWTLKPALRAEDPGK